MSKTKSAGGKNKGANRGRNQAGDNQAGLGNRRLVYSTDPE